MTTCHASLPKIFAFPIVEGDIDCLKDPEKVMVPRSLADKLFGEDISAVGKTLRAEENIWTKSAKLFTIGAVYKDFPENTQLRNVVYTAIDPDYNINNFSSSNWVCYLLLDNPAMADEVADNFNRHFDFKKIYHEGEQIRLVPLTDIYYMNETQDGGTFRSGNKEVTALLFGIALLIVIVAAINFTNFSTSLTPLRIKSINTQKVLGSSDTLLRRSLLIEAALISFMAWLVSLVIVWGLDWAEALPFIEADLSLVSNLPIVFLCGIVALVIAPAREKTGSTDFGNVMRRVPGTCARIAFVAPGAAAHSQEYIEAGKTEAAHDAVIYGAKILAGTALELIEDPELLKQAKEEFRKNLAKENSEV